MDRWFCGKERTQGIGELKFARERFCLSFVNGVLGFSSLVGMVMPSWICTIVSYMALPRLYSTDEFCSLTMLQSPT